ncbi:MAG: hypothetical protein LBM23_00720 [Propionibacteriaceae bacterium]|jgi:hypothetical protein|nr:hypothetical protein [Propionibacteriaceae bacterium]
MTGSPERAKKSVTIPTDHDESCESLLPDGSFSAYASTALRRQVERDNLAQLVDEMSALHDPISDAEIEERVRELA